MKFTGYKHVQLSSLRFDIPDVKKRSKAAHVAELAASIRESGDDLIHAPTVRAESRELVCGRDRIAALIMLKAKKLWVHLVDCTDAEARMLERAENAYRRPIENRDQLIAEMVALASAQIVAESAVAAREGGTVSPPSKHAVTATARKQVARAAGIKPASVKKAQQRAARKASGGGPSAAAETPSTARREPMASSPGGYDMATSGAAAGGASGEDVQPPTLDLLGCDDASGEAVAKFARGDQEAIDRADQLLRQAQGELRKLTTCTAFQQLHQQVHRVASMVRAARPEFICPWCKGLPKTTVAACEPCAGLGYVSHEIAGRSPPELRNADAPIVMIDGKAFPYADVRDGKGKPGKNGKPVKASKTLSVVTTDGNEADLEAAAD